MPSGRKTKLTPELQVKLLSYIRAGNYIRVACDLVGINETTYFGWLRKGEEQQSGIYYKFLQAVKESEAHAEAILLQTVRKSAKDDWKAAMTLMSRRWPDRWAENRKVEQYVTVGESETKNPIINVIIDKPIFDREDIAKGK